MAVIDLSNSNNGYRGFLPSEKFSHLERIDPDKISNEEFFHLFIKQRRPVILTSVPNPMCKLFSLWTNEYLQTKAGHAQIVVEKRADYDGAHFGIVAPKIESTYGEFLLQLSAGNDRLYLTTQSSDDDTLNSPKLLSEPLLSLKGDFPLQPELLGSLVPYQISLWQGNAHDGSSSGLHHDFHDNLYILLRGKKRFRLFPPSAAPYMVTSGNIDIVYPNGLIVYRHSKRKQSTNVREDGALKSDIAKARRDQAELELQEAEEKLSDIENQGNQGNEELKETLRQKITQCEEEIEAALDDLLEYGSGDEDDKSCDEEASSEFSSDLEKDFADDGDDTLQPQPKRRKEELDSDSFSTKYDKSSHNENAQTVITDEIPNHFCKRTLPAEDEAFKNYMENDQLLKNVNCCVCHLSAGEMLYLPASWFHEVSSYSTDIAEQPGHLALNYWAYPPDADDFKHPYHDDYWQSYWKKTKHVYE